ncbi:MAG: hypothetical protein AB7U83_13720 [Vicinamibacterales bacterium]
MAATESSLDALSITQASQVSGAVPAASDARHWHVSARVFQLTMTIETSGGAAVTHPPPIRR